METSFLGECDSFGGNTRGIKNDGSQELLKCVDLRDCCESCSTVTSGSSRSFTLNDIFSSLEGVVSYAICDDDSRGIRNSCSDNKLCQKDINVIDIGATDTIVYKQSNRTCLHNHKEHGFRNILSKSSPYFSNSTTKGIVSTMSFKMSNVGPLKAKSDSWLHVLPNAGSVHIYTRLTGTGLLMTCPCAFIQTGFQHKQVAESSRNVYQNVFKQIRKSVSSPAISEFSGDAKHRLVLENVSPSSQVVCDAWIQGDKASKTRDTYLNMGAHYIKEEKENKYDENYNEEIEEEKKKARGMDTYIHMLRKNIQNVCLTQNDVDIMAIKMKTAKCINQNQLTSGHNISCIEFVPKHSQINSRKLSVQFNVNSVIPTDKPDLGLFSYQLSAEENRVDIFTRNDELCNSVDKEFLNAYENIPTDLSMLISANKNKSGNSGHSPKRKSSRTATDRLKYKISLDSPITAASSSQNQNLQLCLEKARLASTLQGTIGQLRSRAENYAAVKAYEHSVKDFEKSMKNFLQENSGRTTEYDTLTEPQTAKVSNDSNEEHRKEKVQIRQNLLRRSETFVVQELCKSNAQNRAARRNQVPMKAEYKRPGTMFGTKRSDNINNDEIIVCKSNSLKDTHVLPNSLMAECSFDIPSSSLPKLQSCRTKSGNHTKQHTFNRTCASSNRQQSDGVSGYLHIDQDIDTDTTYNVSSRQDISNTMHTPLTDTQPSVHKSYDRDTSVQGHVQPNNKYAYAKRVDNCVHFQSPSTSNISIVNDKQDQICNPTDSLLGRSLSHINPVFLRSQFMRLSLNEDSNVCRKKKSAYEPDYSTESITQKVNCNLVPSVSDLRGLHDGCLLVSMVAPSVSNQSSGQSDGKVICIESMDVHEETSTKINAVIEEKKDSDIRDGLHTSSYTVLLKGECGSSNPHEGTSLVDYSRTQECDTSFLKNYQHRNSDETNLYFKNSKISPFSAEYSQRPSQRSSIGGSTKQNHNKWRRPTDVKKNIFPRLSSDLFAENIDWSSSDDDAIDDLQRDISPNLLKHLQKADIDTQLRELNQYPSLKTISKSPLQKRISINPPRWVENAGTISRFTDNNQTSHLIENTLHERGINPELSPQEKWSATCSYTSTTSDEYILALPDIIVESLSECNFKNGDYDSKRTTTSLTCLSRRTTGGEDTDNKRTSLSNVSPDLCVNIPAAVTKSRNQDHERTYASAVLASDNGSSDIVLDNSISVLGISKLNVPNIDQQATFDDPCWTSHKITAIEQMVREVSIIGPKVKKSPYPVCFASLRDDHLETVRKLDKEDELNDDKRQGNRAALNKIEIDDKVNVNHTKNPEIETIKIYSTESPPKCIHSNKQLTYSHLFDLSENPALYDKHEETCGSEEADDKETYPFSVVADDLDCSSPYDNDQTDYLKPLTKKDDKQSSTVYNSPACTFTGGNDVFILPDVKVHAATPHFTVANSNKCLSFRTTTYDAHTINGPSVKNFRFFRHEDVKVPLSSTGLSNELTQPDGASVNKILLPRDKSDCIGFYGACLHTENRTIEEHKVDHLEKLLKQSELRNQRFHFRQNSSQHQDGSLPLRCPHCLQCVSLESPAPVHQCVLKQGRVLDPSCCNDNSEHILDRCHKDCLSCTPYVYAQSSVFHHPMDDRCADRWGMDPNKSMYSVAAASQTSESLARTDCLRSEEYTCVDGWTQNESNLPSDGTCATFKKLENEISIIREDILDLKRNIVQESLMSLHESLLHQKKEIDEIKFSTEKIASCLEVSSHELNRKGMDFNKMKERIVELTSQRDAEKVFHKITRQALRALERDHDRLRQEYISANCRRYKHGDSGVQNRISYYLNDEDTVKHFNDNHSGLGETQTLCQIGSQREVRRGEDISRHVKHRTNGRHRSRHQAPSADSNHRGLPTCCQHVRQQGHVRDVQE